MVLKYHAICTIGGGGSTFTIIAAAMRGGYTARASHDAFLDQLVDDHAHGFVFCLGESLEGVICGVAHSDLGWGEVVDVVYGYGLCTHVCRPPRLTLCSQLLWLLRVLREALVEGGEAPNPPMVISGDAIDAI